MQFSLITFGGKTYDLIEWELCVCFDVATMCHQLLSNSSMAGLICQNAVLKLEKDSQVEQLGILHLNKETNCILYPMFITFLVPP
jgi:hypothetical protein